MLLSVIRPLYKTGEESIALLRARRVCYCVIYSQVTKQRDVEDVKENPRSEALTNFLKKHTVFWVFSFPHPHRSSYTLKFKSDGKPSDRRLKAVISRLTRR